MPKTYWIVVSGFFSLLGISLSASLIYFSIEDDIFSTFGEILIIETISIFTIIFCFSFYKKLLIKFNSNKYFIAFTDDSFIYYAGKEIFKVSLEDIINFNQHCKTGKALSFEASESTMYYLQLKYNIDNLKEKTKIIDLEYYPKLKTKRHPTKLERIYNNTYKTS